MKITLRIDMRGLMPRNDEELRGPSYRARGHIEDKEHLRIESLCCSTLESKL